MAVSLAHNMGNIVRSNMKCTNCTHKRAFFYSKGIWFCWHCKCTRPMTPVEIDQVNEENQKQREYS